MGIFQRIYCSGYYELTFLFVSLAFAFSIVNKPFKKHDWYKICCGIAFVAYIFVILYATVFHRESLLENRGLSLIPFASYKIAFNGNEEGFRTCFMNALLFYPLGVAFYGFNNDKKIKLRYFILFAFCLSLIIEVSQYIFCLGTAEVDDLIHNTLGAVIGYFVCYVFSKLIDLVVKEIKGV